MERLFIFLLLFFILPQSQAALLKVKSEIVYSDKSQLYWTKDANLLRTMSRKNPNLISEIIASVPKGTIHSRPNEWEKGRHELSERDFGLVFNDRDVWFDSATWWGALAFIHYLNKINYGGYHDWRLPKMQPHQGQPFNFSFSINGSTDLGYNNSNLQSEIGHLFYAELKNLGQYKDHPTETLNPSKPGVTNAGPFIQLKNSAYWYSTEFDQDPRLVWIFATNSGFQSGDRKDQLYVPWPVRSDTN